MMKSFLFFFFLCFTFLGSCQKKTSIPAEQKYTNALIKESSPYLLQHAHNPVAWQAWDTTPLTQAKKENKLMIVSIGYAACHWCHVMEHESFEDPKVAEVMNTNFIPIKVDREERPDVDEVYMTAIQLMTGSGGWPLNVITLPDGRPIWGGTYFPKGDWVEALQQIATLYQKDPERLIAYADKLEQGIKTTSLIKTNPEAINYTPKFVAQAVDIWSTHFDHKKGGTQHVPKFMMPANYNFLLRYAHQTKDDQLMQYVLQTLDQISFGGVYDHLGGGFSRYSTDNKWHIPHFEKMLYDNAQLVSLYAKAYQITKKPWYKEVVYQTLDFVAKDLTTSEGAFYSSLDADSMTADEKLEEGAFYVWTKKELKKILQDEYELFSLYYNVNGYGFWEHDRYVLIRKQKDLDFRKAHALTIPQLQHKKQHWQHVLLIARAKRATPRLDDKTLTSWNALMAKGYIDAYKAFGEDRFLQAALRNATFIKNHQLKEGTLFHNYKNGKSTINGYLEDYATVIDAYIELYQVTLDLDWLQLANTLTQYTITHFYNPSQQLFYFTSSLDAPLVTRTIAYRDNVIPASNSIMAKNMFLLYHYTANTAYLEMSQQMLHTIQPKIASYPSGYGNWLDLMLNFSHDFYEVAILGSTAHSKVKEFNSYYIPNVLLAGSNTPSNEPLLDERFVSNETLYYVCVNNSCKYPQKKIKKVLDILK